MSERISFVVFGRPAQVGSKTPWLPKYKDGSPVMRNGRQVIATMDSNKKSKSWMNQVRAVVGELRQGEPRLSCPVELSVRFYFKRPKGHLRKDGTLLPRAPHHHAQSPDVDKLCRCIGDSLTGVLFDDDKQIVRLVAERHWTLEAERAEVTVTTMDHEPRTLNDERT